MIDYPIKEVLKKYFGDGEGVDLFNSLFSNRN